MSNFIIHEDCNSYMKFIVTAKDKKEALEKHERGESNFIRQNYDNSNIEIEEDKE
mgnify:CR=1 FL=1